MTLPLHRQRGFNLIDLMIGVVISMFAMLAVAVVFRDFGKTRNTEVQAMESQSNGTMALYLIERDLAQAGYAMMKLQNCPFINWYYNGTGYYDTPYGTASLPGSGHIALTTLPVRIIDGDTDSDTLEIQYGNPVAGATGSEIGAAMVYPGSYPINAAVGFASGDRVVTNIGNICTLHAVTNADPVASPIEHANTNPYNVNAAPGGNGWNSVTAGDLTADPSAYMANLGNFVSRRYTVAATGGRFALQLAELPAFTANTVVDEIVFLKAQYGLSATNTSDSVTSWVDGGTLIDNTSAARVIAVRVGVVARSPLLEKEAVAAAATLSVLPALSGTSTLAAPSAGECGTDATTKEVKCTVPDTHFRYRTYSTIIPLKNVIWTR